tara:strand:+ start:314 stop:706 length:393 start_codon:yes stop_codon:yes gene_type:complete
MKNGVMALLVALLALMLGLAYNVWQSRQVEVYALEVINRSGADVDQVRLFGTGVQAESTLNDLKRGDVAIISVMLKKEGGLKFEVEQGGSRIDTFVDKSIKAITSFEQQLVIHPNHRYIISDYTDLSLTD